MPVGSIGKWKVEYPASGTDWATAIASHADYEMAFGVETHRVREADGVVRWRLRTILRPKRMGNDFPVLVRQFVKVQLRERPCPE